MQQSGGVEGLSFVVLAHSTGTHKVLHQPAIMVNCEVAGISDDDTDAFVAAGVNVPVDGTGGGGAAVDGTAMEAEAPEIDMDSDTRLLEIALLRLYW